MKTGRLLYRKLCKISGGFLLFCGMVFLSAVLNVTAAKPDEEKDTTILFSGNVVKEFSTWDNWSEAIRFDKGQFDVSAFAKPFTVAVDYESDSAPILVFFSWSGGPGWAQMNPTFTSKGTAYYTFETISGHYGEDFSLLDAINVMPGGADITITRVAFFYEEAEEISIHYKGTAGEIVNSIKVGWNLGNTLDSHGEWIEQYTAGQPSDFETAWGNPVTTKAMITAVKEAGFNAVRIPVTWDQNIEDEKGFQIKEEWLRRVQEVVDYVIDNDMYCIINVHHDTGDGAWLHASADNIRKNEERFRAVWTQVAGYFAEYDNRLLFEGFNEMLDEDNNWNSPKEEGTAAINTWNQIFVDTVRASGGNNKTRVLIVNTYGAGTGAEMQEDFVIPKDSAENSIIVEMHCYAPWNYCSPISAGSNVQKVWTENGGEATIDGILYSIYHNFTGQGVPVIIGEFGACAKENEADRAEYAKYMVETAQKYGIRCFWWDDGGKMEADPETGYFTGFALLDRNRLEWKYPRIAAAMTEAAVSGVWEVEIPEQKPEPEQKTEQKPERKPKLEPGAEKETKFQKIFSLFGDCVMICYSEKS